MEISSIKLVNGLTLNVRLSGNPDGMPMMALHGYQDNAASFDLLAAELPQLQWVAVDLPGHGFSDHLPLSSSYHLIDFVPTLLQLTDALGWTTFGLIGHSYGGIIAELLAARAGDRISHLILLDILGVREFSDQQIVDSLLAIKTDPSDVVPHTLFPSIEAGARRRTKSRFPVPIEAARLLAQAGMKKVTGGYAWTFDNRIRDNPITQLTATQQQRLIAKITADCCVILGKQGIVLGDHWPQFQVDEFLKSRLSFFANKVYHEINGNHHFHLSEPQATAAIIRGFLNRG